MRPLNEEEKEFLACFNAAFEHHNFKDDFFDISDEEKRELYNRDYERRSDLYFHAKSSGNLVYYDLHEYDKMVTKSEKDISLEDLKLNYLEDKPKKVKRKRAKRKKI